MKVILSIMLFLVFISCPGQTNELRPDQVAFDGASDLYYDEEYDSALYLFQNFLNEFPASALIPRARYNMGYILRETGRDEEAIPVFQFLLNSDYDDKEKFGGLMEQYALYKHRSASHLADIYLSLEKYDSAKKYIRLFDKKYKYQHFGGNEMMAQEIYTARQYARLYHGQGKTDKAIQMLLPYLFDNGLASNTLLLELLVELLEAQYSREEIIALIKQAKSSLKVKKDDTAFIVFLGTKIKVYDGSLFAIRNIEFQENVSLIGREKWEKVLNTNELFVRYL